MNQLGVVEIGGRNGGIVNHGVSPLQLVRSYRETLNILTLWPTPTASVSPSGDNARESDPARPRSIVRSRGSGASGSQMCSLRNPVIKATNRLSALHARP